MLLASLGTFSFYERPDVDDFAGVSVALLASVMLVGWLWTRQEGPGAWPQRALLVLCVALAYLPPMFGPTGEGWPFAAALAFVGLWILVAYVAHAAGSVRVLNMATAVVGVRILIVYFEVFGSLLGTGVGLITGGLLTIALVWFWMRKRSEFARELGSDVPLANGSNPTSLAEEASS